MNRENPENKAYEKIKKLQLLKIRNAKLLTDIIFVFILFICVVTISVLFFILPKKKVSERENRNLETFPEMSIKSLWSGDFTNKLNVYYSDNFVYRDTLVDIKYAINDKKGIKFNDITIIQSQNTSEASEKGVNEIPVVKDNLTFLLLLKELDLGSTTQNVDFKSMGNVVYNFDENTLENNNKDKFNDYLSMNKDLLEGEQRGALYVIGDTALEIFYGNEAVSKKYAEVINTYVSLLGDTVTVYNMIVPNHFEYGLPEKYKNTVGRPQKPFMDIVRDNLDDRVIFIDIYNTLKENYDKGEYLYFRTDHHWTALGAYRAYEKFCEYASLKKIPLESYEKRTSKNFLGTFYNSSMNKDLAKNPDYVDYYVTDLPYEQKNTNKEGTYYSKGTLISEFKSGKTNGYLTFMGGDIPLATIDTENKNGKKIIVFKDSYGNAFIPFIVPHYETVYVADIRSFPYNSIKFIKENNISEVLFLNNIMASNTDARVANIYLLTEK